MSKKEKSFCVNSESDISRAMPSILAALSAGGCILLPTETVYGLAAACHSVTGIRKILALKERPKEKSLPVFVRSVEQAKELAIVNKDAETLMQKFWPGPLTIVLKARADLPDVLKSSDGFVGLRCPNHAVPLRILREFGHPLCCTSANHSGQPPVRSIEEARELFKDDERLSLRLVQIATCEAAPSTVVKIDKQTLQILRQGAIQLTKL